MFQQCRHIQTNGSRCRQVALNERSFCYYHRNRQPRRRRSIIRAQPHTATYDYGAIPVADCAAALQIQAPVELLFSRRLHAIAEVGALTITESVSCLLMRLSGRRSLRFVACLVYIAESVPPAVYPKGLISVFVQTKLGHLGNCFAPVAV